MNFDTWLDDEPASTAAVTAFCRGLIVGTFLALPIWAIVLAAMWWIV